MLNNDRMIKISAAGSRMAARWPTQELCLQEFYAKLSAPVRSTETRSQYSKMKKRQQDDLKDVGGFVGGILAGGVRKAGNVTGRDLITLDMDNIHPGGAQEILKRLGGLGCGWAAYSTRKHGPEAPRLRAIIATDRTLTADEYEPVARKIAHLIDPTMAVFDKTTFEASRLMYYPSCCADSEYIFEFEDKPLISADWVLGQYDSWQDVLFWPRVPGEAEERQKRLKEAGDPTEKKGVVGAFCRTYSVYDAMEKFLPGVYEPVDGQNDRYTFMAGSSTGGAIAYQNGLFLYSHHATDPAGGQLCNAFDLVRLHKFSEKDDEVKPGTPINKHPSYTEMCRLAVADEAVSGLLDRERYEAATEDFSLPIEDEDNDEWKRQLTRNPSTGVYEKTANNVLIILENDKYLKGRIKLDEFANRGIAVGPYPWDARPGQRIWSDNDDAGIRWLLEKVYQITGKDKVFDALSLCGRKHAFDPVKTYLTGLVWDGVPRLDTLFIDFLGAEDTEYTRTVTRKAFTAAVARVMEPGVKFDYMIILTGPQGIGKSTLLRLLGLNWFTDSLKTFEGKEACELVQGAWIVEVSELEALNRSELGRIKQFLSQVEDRFRVPYGRRTEHFPRRCVFFGTSNNSEYLRDRTGNRRFLPVDVGIVPVKFSVFNDLIGMRDQLWAEAVVRWRLGEPLHLSGEVAETAKAIQEDHREQSPREGIIKEFILRDVPADWTKWPLERRKMFWNENYLHNEPTIPRDRVCALEVWCEAFGGDSRNMKYVDAKEINNVIEKTGGWEKKTVRCGYCGVQKGFVKVDTT